MAPIGDIRIWVKEFQPGENTSVIYSNTLTDPDLVRPE
jgi:hypothetical protein